MSEHGNPQRDEAKALGCTCEWWTRGAIVTFDPECPIIGQHRGVPDGAGDVLLADKVIRRLDESDSYSWTLPDSLAPGHYELAVPPLSTTP